MLSNDQIYLIIKRLAPLTVCKTSTLTSASSPQRNQTNRKQEKLQVLHFHAASRFLLI